MKGLSRRIVDFIASLELSCTRQLADGRDCAPSLEDRTLPMPPDQMHAPTGEGWVAVPWQDDGRRHPEMPGVLLACRAILRHVALLGAGLSTPMLAVRREEPFTRFDQRAGIDPHTDGAARRATLPLAP